MRITSAILATIAAFKRVNAPPPSTIWIGEEEGRELLREMAPSMGGPATIETALALGSAIVHGVRVRWPVKKTPLAGRQV